MAETRWLALADLDALLLDLARAVELWAPVEVAGEAVFGRIHDPGEISTEHVNTLIPPKELFLPTPERLLGYRVEGAAPRLEADGTGKPAERVIFGIRSCDVAGLEYLERFLSGASLGRPDLADGPFLARREATTLISVVCEEPADTCMCVCCGGGPSLEHGYDWQLTRLARGWLVEIGSARGERLARERGARLQSVPSGAREEAEARRGAAVARFRERVPRRVPSMAAARMVSTGRLTESFWSEVGERCFECGGCAFVCPTCSCFNVADLPEMGSAGFDDPDPSAPPQVPGGPGAQPRDGRYQRLRLRDNCILPGFVRQAGGGYPRWTCGERCQLRFFHKLSAQFQARSGALGCTGCGRCVITCLGEEGIDRVATGMLTHLTGKSPRAANTAAPAREPEPAR